MDLTSYRMLGRSGLIISPIGLGTMTFGATRWGSGKDDSKAVFDAYVGAGGNFIDTADVYSRGESETMLGGLVKESGLRNRLIISTKAGYARSEDTPLHGGNGAKNIRLGIEGSLQRLQTDYIDLYWQHVWDGITPAEEVLGSLSDAVRAGKILHYGFDTAPAWYVAKIATLARLHGLPAPIGLQYGYSLVDRGIELEIVPAGREFGLGVVCWSPLAAGFLSGKYGRDMLAQGDRPIGLPNRAVGADEEAESKRRLDGNNPHGGMMFSERNFEILDVLREVANEIGRPMAQVALAWVVSRPGVSSVLIGASRPQQVTENITSLDIVLSSEQVARLNAAGALPSLNPYFIFDLPNTLFFGGKSVEAWPLR